MAEEELVICPYEQGNLQENSKITKSREEVQNFSTNNTKSRRRTKRTVKVAESFAEHCSWGQRYKLQMSQVSDATKEQEIGVKQIANAMGQLDQLAFKIQVNQKTH